MMTWQPTCAAAAASTAQYTVGHALFNGLGAAGEVEFAGGRCPSDAHKAGHSLREVIHAHRLTARGFKMF